MKFNAGKFEVVKCGTKTEIKDDYLYTTPNYNDVISEKDSVKNLGVMLDNDMKFQVGCGQCGGLPTTVLLPQSKESFCVSLR